jgi:hypothetical protein
MINVDTVLLASAFIKGVATTAIKRSLKINMYTRENDKLLEAFQANMALFLFILHYPL